MPSSPNSPIQTEHKKFRSFVSPNKFVFLAIEEDNEINPDTSCVTSNIIDDFITTNIQQDNPRASPIYVKNIINYSIFKNALVQIIGPDGFTYKSMFSFLIIRLHGRLMFNVIVNHIMETDSRFHTFMPSTYRSYKVIIRNLHHTTLISDISDALLELGHSTRRIINVMKNGNLCLLLFVELKSNTNQKDILNLSSILYTKIKVKLPYRTNSDPPQCKNCQNYGHTANYCHHPLP
jgi:hypothetical protein